VLQNSLSGACYCCFLFFTTADHCIQKTLHTFRQFSN